MLGLPRAPKPGSTAAPEGGGRGYGNIYTPHAGSMVIQVQREGGLQSRTIVLSPRQVQLLRFATARTGMVIGAVTVALVVILAVEAARVPILTRQLAALEHTATRLDTLQRSLAELQRRYDQVQRMFGAAPTNPGDEMEPVSDSIHRPRRIRPTPALAGTAPSTTENADNSTPADSAAPPKPSVPMD
jgi:hypothetical protein